MTLTDIAARDLRDAPVLYGWRAKRAGGRITVYHRTGKVTHIDTIEIDAIGRVFAVDKDGKPYRLWVG